MGYSRFCPICGTLILYLKTTHCPECNFDLENQNDLEAIERAKKYLDDDNFIERNKRTNKVATIIFSFIGIGIIIYIVVVIFAEGEFFWISHEWAMLFHTLILPCFLGLGLIAGMIAVLTIGVNFFLSRLNKK